MDRPRTSLTSKLIFVALIAICVCLVVLIAQNKGRNAAPDTTTEAAATDETPGPDQWDAEPVRLKVTDKPRKTTARSPVTTPAIPQVAGVRQQDGAGETPGTQSSTREIAEDQRAATGVAPVTVPVEVVSGSATYPTGTPIGGQVLLTGQPPREISIALDPTCGRLHEKPLTTRHYIVGENGGLANVWVYVKNPVGNFSTPTQQVVLDQVACEYQPYVFGVMTQQPVRIKNSDPFLHNVNTTASWHSDNRFNIAQPNRNKQNVKTFPRPELPLKFMCNVHNWMLAYAGVFDHPFFAVTDAEGRFEIPAGLSPGRYIVAARHLKAGEVLHEVEVADGAAAVPLQMVLKVPH